MMELHTHTKMHTPIELHADRITRTTIHTQTKSHAYTKAQTQAITCMHRNACSIRVMLTKSHAHIETHVNLKNTAQNCVFV